MQVLVDGDDYFQREGADVHTEAPISVTQAILGGTVDVETLHGTVEVKIPKGCQPDTKFLLRGKGIQRMHAASKGNHIVHMKVEIPKEITKRQEEILREFDEETKACGNGISGRIAQAAGSAFESIFGKSEKSTEESQETESTSSKDSNEEKEAKKEAAT